MSKITSIVSDLSFVKERLWRWLAVVAHCLVYSMLLVEGSDQRRQWTPCSLRDHLLGCWKSGLAPLSWRATIEAFPSCQQMLRAQFRQHDDVPMFDLSEACAAWPRYLGRPLEHHLLSTLRSDVSFRRHSLQEHSRRSPDQYDSASFLSDAASMIFVQFD